MIFDGPLSTAECEQLPPEPEPRWADSLAEDEADRRFRAKVWTAILCGLAVFWTLVAAAIVGVVS